MAGTTPSAIVLAGGESKRLGRPKALVEVCGTTMLEWAIDHLQTAGCDPIVVVAHPTLVAHFESLATMAMVVENPHPERGRTGSLQVGIRSLRSSNHQPTSVIMAPVDRPGWNATLVRKLLDHGGCACPQSNGRRGHPVLLNAQAIDRVMSSEADEPLRNLVSFAAVDLEAPWLSLNIDTVQDVEALQSRESELLAYFGKGEGI